MIVNCNICGLELKKDKESFYYCPECDEFTPELYEDIRTAKGTL